MSVNPNGDIEVANAPTESVSAISFSPTADLLAAGSWDNSVRLWEVNGQGQSQAKASFNHDGPVLDVCWSKDGSKLFSASADKQAKAYDVATGQSTQVAMHDGPIKAVRWVDAQGGILATGSWDKTVKYWDLRQQQPIATAQLPERVYTMDVTYPLMVVGTAERHIMVYNLNQPTTVYKQMVSPLKWQTRVVACFPGSDRFAVGSVEGRVAIQYVEDKDKNNNFSFKCHRKDSSPTVKDQSLVFAVNAIAFHPVYGTCATAGSDGATSFWDIEARTRLKTFEANPGPIVSTSFDRSGKIFAYAVSYDWSKGYTGMTPEHPNKIMLHACKDEEVKKRPKK